MLIELDNCFVLDDVKTREGFDSLLVVGVSVWCLFWPGVSELLEEDKPALSVCEDTDDDDDTKFLNVCWLLPATLLPCLEAGPAFVAGCDIFWLPVSRTFTTFLLMWRPLGTISLVLSI